MSERSTCDCLEKMREVAAAMRRQGAHEEAWGIATAANYLNPDPPFGFIEPPMPRPPKRIPEMSYSVHSALVNMLSLPDATWEAMMLAAPEVVGPLREALSKIQKP